MTRRHDSLVFEVTQECNHSCAHCYNCWKNPVDYPSGALPTRETLAMYGKVLDETGASLVSLTGGEPMLREDIHEIIAFLNDRGVAVNLITNGSLLSESAIERLAGKISVFELPLLSSDRAIHDAMSGREGAFDDATLAMATLKAHRERVVGVFVATRKNLSTWRRTAELAFALGLDGIMFNRFNPGGEGAKHVEELQASPEDIAVALDIADQLSGEYELSISCSIAMPPCLFDHARTPRLSFGFCAAGTERAYYTLDPLGNLRPCNHSPTILGNVRERGFWELAEGSVMRDFVSARPAFCRGCKVEDECLGGCKAAAEACSGSAWDADPFLAAFSTDAAKPS